MTAEEKPRSQVDRLAESVAQTVSRRDMLSRLLRGAFVTGVALAGVSVPFATGASAAGCLYKQCQSCKQSCGTCSLGGNHGSSRRKRWRWCNSCAGSCGGWTNCGYSCAPCCLNCVVPGCSTISCGDCSCC